MPVRRSFFSRNPRLLSLLASLELATAAYVAAFALRFDLVIPDRYATAILASLPALLACKLIGFGAVGMYSGWWRHVSMRELRDIVAGNALASALFLTSMVFGLGLDGFPRSIFLLDLLCCTALTVGLRLAIRLGRESEDRSKGVRRIDTLVLIVGAGSTGIRLLEEIESRSHLKLAVVGFIDDDPGKIGLRIGGIPVLGSIDDVPALVPRYDVGEVLVAIPSATGPLLRRIVQRCTEAGARHRVVPTLGELVTGRVMMTQMREVKVDDLLAREPVRLDLPVVREHIGGQRVLVTGAAGSIGSELCRQVAGYGPEVLVLYDRHENGMFALEMELRQRFPQVRFEAVLGDVLLPDQLDAVFGTHRPALVFHAAAYKHVPLAEANLLEAVRNNVLGTRNVAQAAIMHRARDFVLVSTDKAVRPTSVMGVTKRIAELVVQGIPSQGVRFVAVRFGNVLGSNGSVVPLFRDQIARGGPVTVTDPDVTRYFMTIPEASQLILQAAGLGQGSEIYILEMGEPVRIADLARNMIRLSGFAPDEDIPIVFTGLRPGEKMFEELVDDGEAVAPTPHDRIRVLHAATAPMRPAEWLPRLEAAVLTGDARATVRMLQTLVPGYRVSSELLAGMPPERVVPARDALTSAA
ncbi:MAG TPA: nucleoside-diphosphate sugar epimerase/dehydratase [Candidatus Binatia bacterium]|jgi:FlaA1/EpsC-like NDP-sugar epimerase|nr:nucleoside-diphosphate sugar epimerase/dehydratase [Candidatus Binatia bacterium]